MVKKHLLSKQPRSSPKGLTYRATLLQTLWGIFKQLHGKVFAGEERGVLSKPDLQPGPQTGTNSSELRRCIGEVSYVIESN